MDRILESKEFKRKLSEAIDCGVYTDYFYNGEHEEVFTNFDKAMLLEGILKLLKEELEAKDELGLFKVPYESIIITPQTSEKDAAELYAGWLLNKYSLDASKEEFLKFVLLNTPITRKYE